MSMFSESAADDGLLNEINMTPLIDVMLVLLIIFIVTLPVMNHALKVDLPRAAAQDAVSHDVTVDISVDASGVISWNKVPVSDGELKQKAAAAAEGAGEEQPTIRIYADRRVPYERVALVLSAAQAGGLTKLNFVTDPAAP